MRGQKELEVIFIKKLFDYKLSMSKCLLTVSWAELSVTTVDTLLTHGASASILAFPVQAFDRKIVTLFYLHRYVNFVLNYDPKKLNSFTIIEQYGHNS